MRLSHDIWHQVIQYFEHDRGDSDAAEKRTALLNLALTSRSLSGLALATLWRNMSSMAPIVDVINSFTPHQEDPFLTWVDDGDGCSYWEFWRKPDGERVFERVKEYFGRIRHFWVSDKFASERALWPILIVWLYEGKPLLPNLQQLVIFFDNDDSTSYYPLMLMVPSTLKDISTMNVRSYHHVVEFYHHMLSRGCSPRRVQYVGDLRSPLILTFFDNLNCLVVKGPYKHDRHRSSFSLVGFLQQGPFLDTLEIDLGTLQIKLEAPLEPFEHPSLKKLTLEGTVQELCPFLSSEITCPLVKRLSFRVRFTAELTWKFLFERVAVIFPNINNFSLEVLEPSEVVPQLDFSDLGTLLPQPMEEFILEGVPNKLTQKDLQSILEAWPKLRTLALTGGETPFNAEVLLSNPTYQNLHTLHLPFDFIPLASSRTFLPETPKKSLLRNLYTASSTQCPSTLKEVIILAQNLFILLPRLKTVEVKDKNPSPGASGLLEIIKGMQVVVATRRV